jgi:hypothetical protein
MRIERNGWKVNSFFKPSTFWRKKRRPLAFRKKPKHCVVRVTCAGVKAYSERRGLTWFSGLSEGDGLGH